MNWLTMFLLIGNTANPFFYESIEMLGLSAQATERGIMSYSDFNRKLTK